MVSESVRIARAWLTFAQKGLSFFMGKELIMVTSITFAIKGRDLLRNSGIRAYIERTPNSYDHAGCGYSIYVPENAGYAAKILERAGIKVLGTAMIA